MSELGLQGRLSDFNLEEILQLVALQQKTGLLRVDASYPMSLYFEQGILVSYRDRRAAQKDPLENFLKNYGFFPNSSWEHIEFVQGNSQLDLTEILVNEGLLSSDELAAVQMEAAQEHLFLGMQLRDGRYQFLSGRANLNGIKGRVSLKADGLLMEAVRRIDEMPTLRERYESGSTKISRSEQEVDLDKLSPGIRRIYTLLDGEKAVHALVAQGKMSEFDVYTTLEAMRETQLIELHAAGKPGGAHDDRASTTRGATVRAPRALTVALAIASCLALAGAWWQSPVWRGARSMPPTAERWMENSTRARIEAELELFRNGHGRYPQNEAQFVASGLSREGVFDGFDYEVGDGGASYELHYVENVSR